MTTDPYAVLGIPNDAATAAIRSSYKKLILQCHPDKVKDESLREEKAIQFQKVQEAYELLIDSRRRRKYDEELVKQAKAAEEAAAKPPPPPPQPQPQPMQTPHMAHAHPHSSHRSASGPGPSPGSAERASERTDRPRRERSGTNPSPDDRQKEKDREARHARKRAEGRGDRKSREESSWSQEERNMRKETQEERYAWIEQEEARKFEAAERERLLRREYEEAQRYPQPQPQAPPQSHSRHPDEQPTKKGYNRYNPTVPRENHHTTDNTKFRSRKAEEERLAKVKAKMSMADEPIRPPVSEERGDLRASEKEQERLQRQDRERRERGGRDRERDRGSEVPHTRERRSSKTPPILRRGSSVTSRCDEVPSTPMMRPAVYGASAPTHNTSPYSSSGAANYAPRRRHSSPSIEKQASRMHPREGPAPCDSGYSSPSSTDTPVPDKKVHTSETRTPEMRTTTDGIDTSSGTWKRYTFEVYIHENMEAAAQAKGGVPSGTHYRQPSSTSPSIHPADPACGPAQPLPAEHVRKAAEFYGIPYYPPPPGSSIHPHSPPSSHHPHSPHSPHASPPRHSSSRHHHSPTLSPRLVSEPVFVSPGLSRSNTMPTSHAAYASHPSRPRERGDHGGYGYAPSLGRNSTFSS
ncbi:uncharacterized protein LAJ45_08891 [Morchella importuna]|uniref:uncharacterized protein n=1 Tax=Morchella importuna TaxID=1174673 RepID=UPI001E8CD47A|nr:uncharacterized protein LAJ45_08891 [Morchella importuna]KAH8147092.1 hypothetical protein LAJ45_08891 [Morchella importuna]